MKTFKDHQTESMHRLTRTINNMNAPKKSVFDNPKKKESKFSFKNVMKSLKLDKMKIAEQNRESRSEYFANKELSKTPKPQPKPVHNDYFAHMHMKVKKPPIKEETLEEKVIKAKKPNLFKKVGERLRKDLEDIKKKYPTQPQTKINKE